MAQEKVLTVKAAKTAYNKYKENPYITAKCMAKLTGLNPRHVGRVLVAMSKDGDFEYIKDGNTYLFRPK